MSREEVFRAAEKRLNEQAAETGVQVDSLMGQLSEQVGFRGAFAENSEQELLRQEAFVRELLHSEAQKTQAREAMQGEMDKLARAMRQLERDK